MRTSPSQQVHCDGNYVFRCRVLTVMYDGAHPYAPHRYKNLFRKVNLIFKWVTDHCGDPDYVLKTDDDSFVRIDKLMELVLSLPK